MSELKFHLKTPKVQLGVDIPVSLFGIPEIPSFDFIKGKTKETKELETEDKKGTESELTSDEKFSLTTGALLLGTIALKALRSSV